MTVKKAVIIGLLLEILIGCLAGVFYFKFYIYTPTYSIRAMQKAMQSGDVEELKNRVDLETTANWHSWLTKMILLMAR